MEIKIFEFMKLHLRALYRWDAHGRMTGINQFDGGDVPQFHLVRCDGGCLAAYRQDLPVSLIQEISELVEKEPVAPVQSPQFEDRYVEILGRHQPGKNIWRGPAYRFAGIDAQPDQAIIDVTPGNAHVLEEHMSDWLVDVLHRSPFVALIEDGHAVAVCASVRTTSDAHEAGVETVEAFRGRGHARRVVRAWAQRVAASGAVPLYSTSWDNLASQAVAGSLGLEMIGSDFHVR